MGISNFQVQYILRSYSRQLVNRAGVFKGHISKEEVTLSQESRKRLLVDSIVREILSQFRGETPLSERCREYLEKLSQEYGQPLEISNSEEQGIVFKVLDKKNGEVKCLSASENKRLECKLLDILQSTVYRNLTETSPNIHIPDEK